MSWVIENWPRIADYGLAHLLLSLPPIVLGLVIALPLGWLAHRFPLSRGVLLVLCGILYAIPSLPLFIVLPGLIGTKVLDPVNVVVALTIYAVALLVRAVADALGAVDQDVLASSTALGTGAARRFWTVELPLSGPVIIAGLRVVAVSTVSLVTVGSVIGVQSFGYFFLDGYQRSFPLEIVVGILGTVVIALVLDGIIVLVGRLLMPWNARIGRLGGRGGERRDRAVRAAARLGAA